MKSFFSRKRIILLSITGILILLYSFSLPGNLFNDPVCTVLEDRNDQLLCATIARDGQWRFPENSRVPEKFAKAAVAFEDKHFWNHPGIDVLALGRALRQNIRAGHIVSGGSTITMQLVRLYRKNPPRTLLQKCLEIILATRLEIRYSKNEILALYASHAPFGGNVVGLEAACWRYFGRGSSELSWGEAALLAVLPNNPSLFHLSRQRDTLRKKRDGLLLRLHELGEIDELSYRLAVAEPIPDQPTPLPRIAVHALSRLNQEGRTGEVIHSSIHKPYQERVELVLNDYFNQIKINQIHNAAVLVMDVKTGEVLAYAGNTLAGQDHHEDVDVIRSPRSTGSILKPFLFAAMLDEGKMLPGTLVPDIPTVVSGFAPKNFSRQYDGAVPARQALIRSLNIPAVIELREYRYEKFHDLLVRMGLSTLTMPPDHYGLSLILGGAEGTLWDITGMYASCARILNNYFERPGVNRYRKSDFHPPVMSVQGIQKDEMPEESSLISAASIWTTFEALKELYRPGEETGWRHFNTSKPVAWKTGTSFGYRDGWAVGVNPDFAVGVWVGNADGEGRPGLTGTDAAAPLLFNIFSFLPGHSWFQQPNSELTNIAVCPLSGQRVSEFCEKTDTISVPVAGLRSEICRYHFLVHLSPDSKFRVHIDCEPSGKMVNRSWFVLPPVQEYYYKARNLSYRLLPPYRKGCQDPSLVLSMGMVYPKSNSKIFIPKSLDGQMGQAVFEATHRNPAATVYWHLDGQFVTLTQGMHRVTCSPLPGAHVLTLVDDSGETLQLSFEVISGK